MRAYVGRVRRELESGRAVVTIPQLHPPGEEAEVDFGGVSVWLDGVLTELSMFVMRLSHSGRAVHVCFPGEGQEAFLEGHTLAFERLGGVPRRVRYDNLKAAVTRVLAGRERIESDRFAALRSHFGFDAFFCEPGIAGAHEKGGARSGASAAATSCRSRASRACPSSTRGRADDARHIAGRLATVGQAAEAEQPALRPLPAEPGPHGRAAGEGRPQGAHLRAWLALLGTRRARGPDGGRAPRRRDRDRHRRGQGGRPPRAQRHKGRGPRARPLLGGAVPQARRAARRERARAGALRRWLHRRARTLLAACPRRLGDGAGTRALVEAEVKQLLLLHRHLPAASVHAALDAVERLGAADPALVAIEARRIADGRRETAVVERPALRRFERPAPNLAGYDALLAASTR